jgi:hypothetical protein
MCVNTLFLLLSIRVWINHSYGEEFEYHLWNIQIILKRMFYFPVDVKGFILYFYARFNLQGKAYYLGFLFNMLISWIWFHVFIS